jgi:hypothetical protein
MSATSGGTTWWRCTVCQHIQAAGAAPPPPPAPALAPAANRARYASGAQPAYQGETTSSALNDDPPSRVGVVARTGLPILAAPSFSTANGDGHQARAATAPPVTGGCSVCGGTEVQYVLEIDVGIDAATLAADNFVRSTFCSVDCLAEKLGLVRR